MKYEILRDAVRELYYSAYWYPDRPCKAEQLWTKVRDAAGFEPGQSAVVLGRPREPKTEHRIDDTKYTRRNEMGFLNVDRQALINDLKQNVAEIIFLKKNGERRIMNCTLQPSYLPEEYRHRVEEEANRSGNQEVLAVWDVDAGAWRSFRLEWVHSVQQKDGY